VSVSVLNSVIYAFNFKLVIHCLLLPSDCVHFGYVSAGFELSW